MGLWWVGLEEILIFKPFDELCYYFATADI